MFCISVIEMFVYFSILHSIFAILVLPFISHIPQSMCHSRRTFLLLFHHIMNAIKYMFMFTYMYIYIKKWRTSEKKKNVRTEKKHKEKSSERECFKTKSCVDVSPPPIPPILSTSSTITSITPTSSSPLKTNAKRNMRSKKKTRTKKNITETKHT